MNCKNKVLFITLFVIIISEDTLIFGTNINPVFIGIRLILYVVLILFLFNRYCRYINKHLLIFTIIISFCVFFTMLLNKDFRNGYFIHLLVILVAFKIVNLLDFEDFMESFTKVMYFISTISIVLFLIVFFVPQILDRLPIIKNYGDVEFSTIILSNIMRGGDLLRNSSIFREPGVFGLYLTICLLFEFFQREKLKIKNIIIFSAALISTFSTMAFVCFALIIIGYVFNTKNLKAKKYTILSIIVFLIFIFPSISENIFFKFNTDAAEYRSTLSRISSITVPLSIFKDHPWGVGLTNFVTLYPLYSFKLFGLELKPDSEATNTIINTFAIYGVIYGLILIYSIWRMIRRYEKSKITTLLLFTIYIFLFSSQEFRFSLLFNILIMYGFTSKMPAKAVNQLNCSRI